MINIIKKNTCACGSTNINKKKHEKTLKHINYITSTIDPTIAPIKLIIEKKIIISKVNTELIIPSMVELMDSDQLLFIKSDIKNCILVGNPGCGKTKTIIEYCIDKYNSNNKLIKSSNNFLIISFSKKAQIDFINRGNKSSQPKLFNNKNVRTIHSLAKIIFDKLFKKSSNTINTIILATYINILNDNTINLLDVYVLQNCKFIIIDEAQDINENQYNLIKLISLKLNIPLILVGDPNQNIYQFQGGSDKFMMNHEKNIIFNLTYNYRSNKEIVNFCNYLRPYDYLPKMICAKNKNGDKPLIYSDSVEKILEHIENEINNGEYNLEDIAIIGPVKLSKSNDGIYLSIGLQLICNFLDSKNIKFIKHFKDPGNKEFNSKEDFKIIKGYVNLLTAHGCKGLEFKKTLVINYHFNTFSRVPTNKDYNIFKYLWYVTLSRAIDKLIIYVDSTKLIFPSILKIPKELYNIEGKSFNISNLKFNNDEIPLHYSVTGIINENKYFDENIFYEFNEKFKYTIDKELLFNIDKKTIFEHDKYSCLYGLFIEKLFMFYYYINKNDILHFIDIHIKKLDNILIIDKEYLKIYTGLKKKNIIDDSCTLNIENIDKNYLTNEENNFILYCYEKIKTNIITIYIKTNLFEYDKNYLIKLYDSLLIDHNEKIIFDIILYHYQIENECLYLLKYNFQENYESLKPYFIKLNELTKQKIYDNFNFQVYTKHQNINLTGIIDIVQNIETIVKIIEIKFVNSVDEKHIIQTLLYYNNYSIDWKIKKNLEIWNLLDGYKYIITFDDNINPWDLNCFICKILKIKMKNNIFMLDLETNTKNTLIDFTEPSNTEIIDRYVYEYNFDCCVSEGLIKNIEPLTTTHITGITIKDLEIGDKNLDKFTTEMNNIMLFCVKPVFIAHNGKRFDFKILFYYNLLNQNKIRILDSMHFIRLFVHNKNISNKLIDLYNYLLNTKVEQTHRAKGDTILIINICHKLNLKAIDLINMCDSN